MKKKRTALFHSVISLLLCVSMLIGTTFAWFTDSVTTGINTIAAGNLDVELYHSNAAVTNERVNSGTKLFMDLQGDPILWEPGVVSYENLRITNEGDLALAYQLAMNTANENFVVDPSGAQYGLSQILKVGFVEGGITATDRAGVVASVEAANWTTMSDFLRSGSLLPEGAGEAEKTWGIVIYWEPGENDNLWNLNNGKQLNEGEALSIDLGAKLIATQTEYESDAFGNDYDSTAKTDFFPVFLESSSATTTVTPDADNKTVEAITMQGGEVAAAIPAGVLLAEGTTELTLTVTEKNASDSNVILGEDEAQRALDVHIEGVSADNTVPIIIDLGVVMPTGLNMGNYTIYHVENGVTNTMTLVDAPANHNEYSYDPSTGRVVVAMATFSELTLVADRVNPWKGQTDYTWYTDKTSPYTIANADQLYAFARIVGGMDGNTRDSFEGKTVKLTNDVNLNDVEATNTDKIFYPIGYYYNGDSSAPSSTVYSFEGIFDGTGHTISNFYQNTWEIKGDYDGNYYKDGMGLFGYVYNGTVKNLTVDHFSSDGEFTPTGVIAAYADGDATFENIAITNCNPRVYNTGNGGIIGIAGSTGTDDDSDITLKNITVDNSNKISALWGSWDVACGGLVGMYRGNVDGNGDATGDTISFTNCHVAAQIDVNNDVCANYQYYAYRYAGMIIGSIRHNTTNDANQSIPNMAGISASGCTVNYGDWNDYYYCELVDNSIASYTHDYQFSRLTRVGVLPESASGTAHYYVKNSDGTVTCRHFIDGKLHKHSDSGTEIVDGKTVDIENNVCVYLPFDQMFTGYGWGVTSKGLNDFDGITIQITESDQNESVEKFETKFTGNFLYRVGNQNAVSVGSLFAAIDGKTINSSGVYVTVESLYEEIEVSGTFTASTTEHWEDGTIQLSGTGPAKIIIQDYDYCEPTELIVEIVDAKNATAAMDATANNVVLLNDVYGASNINIANSYTYYGNGFTLTYTGDGSYSSKDLKRGFIEIETGGQLENTRVKCNVFPEAYIYTSEMTAAPYKYQFSAVMISGNSRITNCYIYGARNNICVGAGNVTISDTITECGSLSNIQIDKNSSNAYTVTLNNVTTIQYQVKDPYEGNTMLGVGVMVGTNESSSNANIHLKGTFKQYNWVNADDAAAVSNEMAKAIIDAALNETTYIHTVNGKSSANLGIIYLNQLGEKITNETGLPYVASDISMNVSLNGMSGTAKGRVYALSNATDDQIVSDPETADKETVNGYYEPQFSFDDDLGGQYVAETTDCDEFCYVEGDTVKVMFLKGETKTLDLAGLVNITKYSGQDLNLVITCVDADGNSVTVTDAKISLAEQKDYTIHYTVTDDMFFDQNAGTADSSVTYSWTVPLTVSLKDKGTPNAYFDFDTSKQVIYYSGNSITGYTQFIPFLAGLSIYDYEEGSNAATLRFNGSDTENGYSKIKSVSINNVNTTGEAQGYHIVTVELNDGGKLVIDMDVRATSGGSTHTGSIKVANSVVYVVNDGTTSAKGQQWKIYSYKFTGNNGVEIDSGAITFGSSGTDASSGTKPTGTFGETAEDDSCVTPDTLITLANGEQVRVDSLTGNEELLVWNMETGKLDSAPILFVDSEEECEFEIIHLYFSDGTDVKVISEHGFWDYDLNKYVYLDRYAEKYIGHSFAKQNGSVLSKVTLTDVVLETEVTTAWSPVTAGHLCYFVNGMLSMPGGVGGLFNIFAVDPDTMTYDYEAMQRDIETYGLYTYEELNAICPLSEEMFNMAGGAYLKISIGKGNLTVEELIYMINRYSKFF